MSLTKKNDLTFKSNGAVVRLGGEYGFTQPMTLDEVKSFNTLNDSGIKQAIELGDGNCKVFHGVLERVADNEFSYCDSGMETRLKVLEMCGLGERVWRLHCTNSLGEFESEWGVASVYNHVLTHFINNEDKPSYTL